MSFGLPLMMHNALKDTCFMLKAAAYKGFAGIGEGMLCTRWCVFHTNWCRIVVRQQNGED